ncbi:MAG: PAS domain S-box protein [Planctomycetota bacterium]
MSLIHPDDRRHVEEQMRRRLSGQAETSRFETRVVRADGNIAYVEVLGSRLNCADGPALVGAVIDITERKQTALALEERLRFERLLADLSVGFINLPCDEIDRHIDASLKALVEFLGNDRSTFIEFGDDDKQVNVTHSFAVSGCETFPIGPIAVARLPWFINQFRSGKCVFVRDIAKDLPSAATDERHIA